MAITFDSQCQMLLPAAPEVPLIDANTHLNQPLDRDLPVLWQNQFLKLRDL
jgi:hypothetical protein